MFDEDVVDHIAKVLELLDLIKIPGVDSHRLRIKVFPLSLADDARQWWINKGERIITTWEELVEKFFCKFYPESDDGENKRRMDKSILSNKEWKSDYENRLNTATSSFFKAHDERDIKEGNELRQVKRKGDNKNDEQPNKRVCKEEKFEAIKYSLGPNEEYLDVRRCEYNTWERNEDSMYQIYQEIFQKKDNGWKVTRTE
ncbi:ribonuclease H-like domain-containing protein [Tanacetum coccineum]